MKKKIVIVSIVSVIWVLLTYIYISDTYFRDKIALKAWMKYFNINIMKYNPSITYFEEKWYPNGDGDVKINFTFQEEKFKSFISENIIHLKQLSICDNSVSFTKTNNGFYLYKSLTENDNRNYVSVQINESNNECCILVEIY